MAINNVNGLPKASKPNEASITNKKLNVVEVSTFADVRPSKTAPVQAKLVGHVKDAIGDLFTVEDADYQSVPDYSDPDKVNHQTVYTVRSTNRKSWLGSKLFEVRVKDQKPVISAEELQRISDGDQRPVVLRFLDLAYYHYAGGETISASSAEKVNISSKEARERGI